MNNTEGNEKPVKQENKANSECNSWHASNVVFTKTNNTIHFLTGTAWLKTSRTICLARKSSK